MPPDNRALFEARDPGPVTDSIADESNPKKYMGPERRRENRRQARDRRGDVRFELNSSDRREKPGRREDDANVTYW